MPEAGWAAADLVDWAEGLAAAAGVEAEGLVVAGSVAMVAGSAAAAASAVVSEATAAVARTRVQAIYK